MTEIKYIKADATFPQSEGNIIIPHICNDIGAWGKGFVLALSKRWKAPEKQYKLWYQKKEGFVLGAVQFVQVEENIWVGNIIGQHKIQEEKGIPPIRYEAVREGLEKVASFAQEKQACVQMPRRLWFSGRYMGENSPYHRRNPTYKAYTSHCM